MLKRFEAPESSSDDSESDDSDDSGDGSSSYESSGSPSNAKRRRTDGSGCNFSGNSSGLAIAQMTAMCDGAESRDDSVYATQARDADRVKRVMKTSCCKAKCKKGLSFQLVMKMITLFWALPKVSQDCVLWSMQQVGAYDANAGSDDDTGSDSEESEERQHRIKWFIEGLHVAKP